MNIAMQPTLLLQGHYSSAYGCLVDPSIGRVGSLGVGLQHVPPLTQHMANQYHADSRPSEPQLGVLHWTVEVYV